MSRTKGSTLGCKSNFITTLLLSSGWARDILIPIVRTYSRCWRRVRVCILQNRYWYSKTCQSIWLHDVNTRIWTWRHLKKSVFRDLSDSRWYTILKSRLFLAWVLIVDIAYLHNYVLRNVLEAFYHCLCQCYYLLSIQFPDIPSPVYTGFWGRSSVAMHFG